MNTITQAIKTEAARQGKTAYRLGKDTGIDIAVIARAFAGGDLRCETASKCLDALGIKLRTTWSKSKPPEGEQPQPEGK